jgi:hypothetical protein
LVAGATTAEEGAEAGVVGVTVVVGVMLTTAGATALVTGAGVVLMSVLSKVSVAVGAEIGTSGATIGRD